MAEIITAVSESYETFPTHLIISVAVSSSNILDPWILWINIFMAFLGAVQVQVFILPEVLWPFPTLSPVQPCPDMQKDYFDTSGFLEDPKLTQKQRVSRQKIYSDKPKNHKILYFGSKNR